jgi:hypothetical protein
MAEPRLTDEGLGRALSAAARETAFPPTPSLGSAVSARLEADRAARKRPAFPRVAIWSRRRTLVFAAISLLAVLGLAFGARFVLGAAEVRVQPGATPSGPPLGPGALGEAVPVADVSAAVGFEVALPDGPGPDEAFVVLTDAGPAALLAWDAGDRYGALPDTPWGLVLLQLVGDDEIVTKTVDRFEDLHDVRVNGRRAFWIDAPHELLVATESGDESFTIQGNVLIWAEGLVTFRMETSLRLRAAIALAETIG